MEVRHVITQTDVDSLQYTDQIQQSEAESTSGISEEEPIVGTQITKMYQPSRTNQWLRHAMRNDLLAYLAGTPSWDVSIAVRKS